ncbi:class I SAM-dependent methyltransferase [Paenibacillus sp. J2TS4]|uniref:class I SAM-dependent methyltransferase n=1 Tax=Paenibacillus sp. J2TS4 TaxID=2807194 RepID=UPI001B11FF29|nr:class I SAM-dependent methyltransferase [Paenibacillus sp. J2TS4]GIP34451.1 SAM-dependent methyltransferase [Paenibacillus sp. J2TS4]
MGFISILSYAHRLAAEQLQPGDIAVDATVGNGVDTLFLAERVGPSGQVYGFDIQPQALRKAAERMDRHMGSPHPVQWIEASHALMKQCIPTGCHGKVGAIMFNLGYLPGSDHATITVPESTLPALDASLELLRPGGVITIALYTGHAGGEQEAAEVEQWAAQLPQQTCQVLKYELINQRNHPPYLIAVAKK